MIDATLRHIPNLLGSFGRGWFVQAVLIDDISHCYDIFGLRHVMLDVILGHTPLIYYLQFRRSDFAFIWIRCSDFICITFASSTDQMFRLRLLHIRRSDFTFILIKCSHFICITFASSADQTFKLRLLHRHSDFAFILIRCSDFICITFASTAYQTFRFRLLHIRRSDVAFILIRCSHFICITFASSAN